MPTKFNAISANSLFHFTSSLDNLVSILTHDFYPRYCPEDHSAFHKIQTAYYINPKRAIPMVCFCDIPLSQIRNHIRTYGYYAVGLSKSWGLNNKISPVMYTTQKSNSSTCLSDCFSFILKEALNSMSMLKNNSKQVYRYNNLAAIAAKLDNIIFYTKPYEGKFYHNGKTSKKVRFYDEREWRYIPDMVLLRNSKVMPSIPIDDLLDDEVKNDVNTHLANNCKLSFTPNDIKYIVVKNSTEILSMIDLLAKIKSPKYDPTDIKLLKTKIISTEQILADF